MKVPSRTRKGPYVPEPKCEQRKASCKQITESPGCHSRDETLFCRLWGATRALKQQSAA